MNYDQLDQFAQKLPDGRWLLASFNQCAGVWYAVPVNPKRPVDASELEGLLSKRVRAFATREEAVRTAWLRERSKGEGGEMVSGAAEDNWPFIFYRTKGGEAGWLTFDYEGGLENWLRAIVSDAVLTKYGIPPGTRESMRALEARAPSVVKGPDIDSWKGKIRAWLSEFERLAVGTRLERSFRFHYGSEVFADPVLVASFQDHLKRLRRRLVAPAENVAEFEAMLYDQFGPPGTHQ